MFLFQLGSWNDGGRILQLGELFGSETAVFTRRLV